MLKHKITKLAVSFAAAVCLFGVLSCKSSQFAENDVDPLALLDGDCFLYISIPVQTNKDFSVAAVSKMAGLNASDSEQVVKRLSNVYVATNLIGKTQLSAQGAFPQGFLKLALTEKNGWTLVPYENRTYYTREKLRLQLSVPSSSVCCVSNDIPAMLDRFNQLALPASDAQVEPMRIDEKTVKILTQNKNGEICFYAPVAKNFLRKFLGTEITFGVQSLSGVLTQLPNSKSFGLKLVIELSDPRMVKAACAALKFALFPVPAKIMQTGTAQITVSDYTFDWSELLSYMQ